MVYQIQFGDNTQRRSQEGFTVGDHADYEKKMKVKYSKFNLINSRKMF